MRDWGLRVDKLSKWYGPVMACEGVSFEVGPGEALGIIGESGSGKSTVLRCVAGDVAASSGAVQVRDAVGGVRSLLELSPSERRQLRVSTLAIVYQDPSEGLDLSITAGGNIAERLTAAGVRNFAALRNKAKELLGRMDVDLSRMDDPVYSFSGGMRQRVQLAKAVANNPGVLLLDEPTTGLDASVAAGVLDLVRGVLEESRVTALVVSHDVSVVSMLARRVIVMHEGRVVETGLTDQLLEDPQHPYSQQLVAASRG
jgi:phosphonate C-P lyase system protein PhnK